jgi:hypothetical protein
MDGTILGQGTFTSNGLNVTLAIPSGADFLNIYNYTQSAASASGYGVQYYWQLGMGNNGIVYSNGTANALTCGVTTGGFYLYTGLTLPGPLNNGSTGISAISAATPPVATVGSTAGFVPGQVVRLINMASTAGTSTVPYSGMDFTVGIGTLDSTHFSIDYLNTLTTTSTGSFRVVGFPVNGVNGVGIITTDGYFYPRVRYITNITAAAQAVITLSVQHNYQVGQQIRISMPDGAALWGNYSALDNYGNTYPNASSRGADSWTVVAINSSANTITINASTSGFGTFVYPTTTSAYTYAQVVPFGENTAYVYQLNPSLSSLGDAVQNQAFLGMTLTGGNGASNPGGGSGDVVYWVAGKSLYGGQ